MKIVTDNSLENIPPLASETLVLIEYHKQLIRNDQQSEDADAEGPQKIIMLDKLKDSVLKYIAERQKIINKEKEIEVDLLKSRKTAECPECEVVREVIIIGEEKNEELDVLCDTVICTVCKTEFMNSMPNNWHDRLILYEYIIDNFSRLIAEENKRSNNTTDLKEMQALVDDCIKFRDIQLEVERTEKEMRQAFETLQKSIEDIHEYLLIAQLNGMHWDGLKTILN
jgi:hypothetical protein